jgi:outer membrane murein-binding lipoprotein Lpp
LELRNQSQALGNLQLVLEQFQAEQESVVQTRLYGLKRELSSAQQELQSLRSQCSTLQEIKLKYEKLEEDHQKLRQELEATAADRARVNAEVENLRKALTQSMERLGAVTQNEQNSIDKRLVKKLFVTYCSPGAKRNDVLDLAARILDFTEEEKTAVGLGKRGWGLGFFGRGKGTQPAAQKEKSLMDLWVEFLLREAEAASQQQQQQSKPLPQAASSPSVMPPAASSPSLFSPVYASTSTAPTHSSQPPERSPTALPLTAPTPTLARSQEASPPPELT